MIKNIIRYKNKVILTLYHQGFPQDDLTLKRFREEHIGKNRIIFSEEYVPDDEWNNLIGYAWEESALITPKEKYNPYYEKACANMIHRIFPDKPAVFLGDVFLFSPSEFEYHSNEENSIILHKLESGMRIIVHLKNRHNIVESKTIDITEDTEELEITTKCNWNNHDIEIYKDNQLIYIKKDISYIRSMHLNFSIAGRKKRIPLTTLQEYYELELQNEVRKSIIGTPPEPVQKFLAEMNQTLVHKLDNQKASEMIPLFKALLNQDKQEVYNCSKQNQQYMTVF